MAETDGGSSGAGGRGPGSDFSYLDVGWAMLGSVGGGLLGGWLLDRWLHTQPWLMVIGGMVGIGLGMYEMILMATRGQKRGPKG